MINFSYENFTNYGFLKAVLSEDQLKPIKEEINFIAQNFESSRKKNSDLAGNIEKEYALNESFYYLEFLLLPLAHTYINTNDYLSYFKKIQNILGEKKDPKNIKLTSAWVNFQNKHEFNPIHNHDGLLSFVIWIDIPFFNKDEFEQPNVKNSSSRSAGAFSFLYQDILGVTGTYDINADKNYNNGLILFPAQLNHIVYPFSTSNKYRVSVAGNFGFTKNK